MKVIFYSVILVIMFFGATSNAATLLYFNSEPGDYIGQGINKRGQLMMGYSLLLVTFHQIW